MKHLLIADKTLLVGDEVAELLRYSALLAQLRSGDSVSVHATDRDGNDVTAGLLLNSGTAMVVESTTTSLPAPRNAEAEEYLRSRIASYDMLPEQPLGSGRTEENDAPWGA